MPIYNKLVRDLIPEIIKKSGAVFTTSLLNDEDYLLEVHSKMHEELAEYKNAETLGDKIEELADLLELIHAAASYHGSSFIEVEQIRLEKAKKHGGFNERIFLKSVEE